jgi:hypothetical protein
MKQIIIFLLIVIVGIIGYGQYKQYQRFSLENYAYTQSDKIDDNYYDQGVIYNYYEAIEMLNNYIITQWSANNIDVRTPEEEDAKTQMATNKYAEKLAKVKHLESILEQSKVLKNQGLSNSAIVLMEKEGITEVQKSKAKADAMVRTLLKNASKIRLGERNALVYEIQKLLVKKGFNIPVDGVYKNATSQAILEFEVKNDLFPDGTMDAITLEALLQ